MGVPPSALPTAHTHAFPPPVTQRMSAEIRRHPFTAQRSRNAPPSPPTEVFRLENAPDVTDVVR